MHDFGFLNSKCALPEAASPERVEVGLSRWLEAATEAGFSDFAEQIISDPLGRKALEAVFGNSPFLTAAMIHDPGFTQRLLTAGPDETFSGIMEGLGSARGKPLEAEALALLLRAAKRQTALTVALADIAGVWPLEKVTGALSDFAAAALGLASAHVLTDAAGQGAFTLNNPDDPERDSGLIVIAMGKLGARELNYSSDIDLIVLYDPEKIIDGDGDGDAERLQKHFVGLTKKMVRLIDERTADGYVFRVDLRLRPDPGVTPVAIPVLAAETYYETLGQNWERAAMIKGRPVAGDIDAGDAFLKRLTPFIWRKNLDFAAIQDIHSIKRQIQAHKGGGDIAVGGHNIKLGRGGIREIEFFAQTQQLIWGGREAALRAPGTTDALSALAENGRCDGAVADDLIQAYEFLRRLEHRLQMINDEQTQIVPERPDELEKVAIFMGYPGTEDFSAELIHHLSTVQNHYGNLFGEEPSLGAVGEDEDGGGGGGISGAGNLVFTGGERDPETMIALKTLGYGKPEIVDAAVRDWHHGRIRATRSQRAREILTELMPVLLKAIGRTPAPDTAFLRFDEFLTRLPAGVQLFSLFHANPQLLDLVAEIMGKAPRLAEHLSHRPAVLDSVLNTDFFDPPPARDALLIELKELLARTDNFEQKLDISRRWNNDRRFQVGVQCLRGVLQPADAGQAFSNVAETALAGLYPAVEEEFVRRHGHIQGASMVVLALGKLGSREMMASSDLDLIFIYATPGDDGLRVSDGEHPLEAVHYFRPAQPAADQCADGADIRRPALRGRYAPSPVGRQGPDCVHPRGFHPLSRRHRLDVGTHGADPGQDTARAGRFVRKRSHRHPRYSHHPPGPERTAPGRRRHAQAARQGKSHGVPVGPETPPRRHRRYRIHRPVPDPEACRPASGPAWPRHPGNAFGTDRSRASRNRRRTHPDRRARPVARAAGAFGADHRGRDRVRPRGGNPRRAEAGPGPGRRRRRRRSRRLRPTQENHPGAGGQGLRPVS